MQHETLEARRVLATVTNLLDGPVVAAGDLPGSLRQAIFDTNNSPDDVIDFDAGLSGTIMLTDGELSITDNVQINGPGASEITIDAGGNSRVLNIDDGNPGQISVEIVGLTITGGSAVGDGGGIRNVEDLTVTDSTISGNSAGVYGGGIFNSVDGTAEFTNSTISGNYAQDGGGITTLGTADFNNSTISGNYAVRFGGGFANGILDTADFNNCTISGNSAGYRGGGVFNSNDGTLEFTNSTISGNSATNDGGGVHNSGTAEFINSTISGNSAGGDGGGIYNFDTADFNNSTISENMAAYDGGGIHNYYGTATVSNSTISGNSAGVDGGGIWNYDYYGTATVNNTIVAGNFGAGGLEDDIEGLLAPASGFNLIGDAATAGGLTNGVDGNIVGVDWTTVLENDGTNPTLADNGGPTQTIALLPLSPAIDAGDPGFGGIPMFDQRGNPFAREANGRIDIGAYEIQGAILGFKWEDLDGDGVWDPGEPGLNDWIIYLDLNDNDMLDPGEPEALTMNNGINDGAYGFGDLAPDDYVVREILPDRWAQSYPGAATDFEHLVTIANEDFVVEGEFEATEPPNFGNFVLGSIHGFKFEDVDADGIYDEIVDLPQAGVEFTLTGTDGLGNVYNETIFTDLNGEFWFEDLLPSVDGEGMGTGYTVTETVPAGFASTTPPIARTFNLFSRQELVWQDDAADLPPEDPRVEEFLGEELMWGNTIGGSIHGFKFEDFDFDGIYDELAGDIPFEGIVFELVDAGGVVVDTIATNVDGEFWFEQIIPGDYIVREVLPPDVIPTTPTQVALTVGPGEELVWREGAANLPPDPVEQVDQSQPVSDATSDTLDNLFVLAQTFTAGITGQLTQVDIEVTTTDPVGDVTMEIRELDGFGDPVGAVLGSVTIAGADVPIGADQPLSFDFSATPPELVAGTMYAIVLSSPTTSAPGQLSWDFDSFTSYADGTGFVSNDAEATWDPEPTADLVFTTTMQPEGDPRFEVLVGDQLVFGNSVLGSIHGFKFEDFDADGVYEPLDGDVPFEGIPFELTGIDGMGFPVGPLVVASDVNGEFWFENLLPGTYTVREMTELLPLDVLPSTPVDVVLNLGSRQELVWADGAANLDPEVDPQVEVNVGEDLIFGNYVLGSIHGFKFEDLDGDGVYEPGDGDVPFKGIPFELTGTDGLGNLVGPIVVESDHSGEFWFEDLVPGNYTVREMIELFPAAIMPTTPTQVDVFVGSRQELVWAEGAAMLGPFALQEEVVVGETLMFGNKLLGSIHGYKFEDFNNNKVQDPGEDRLPGWEIQLFDGNGNFLQSVVTDANGEYWFIDLMPGTYVVREVLQDGWLQTTHNPPPLTIIGGEVYVGEIGQGMLEPPIDPREEILEKCLIFGNRLTSSIHGYKFHDLDGDGTDDGEPRLPGVEIILTGDTDNDGVEDQRITLTDEMGEYWFEDLFPGTYTITETIIDGSEPTTNLPITVTLLPGEEVVAIEGQSTAMGPLGPDQFESLDPNLAIGNTFYGSIHGYKFKDKNFNGVDDAEPGISGVTITLLGTDGLGRPVQRQTLTDANGLYWFEDVYPGVYAVTETVPPGAIPTTELDVLLTIQSGEEAVAAFGLAGLLGPFQTEVLVPELAFGNFYPGSIHGHKFQDHNGDGVEDPGEVRLNGWTITLTDQLGNPVFDFFGNQVQPVVTSSVDVNGDGVITENENGLYWFENLLPGTYIVREVQQDGFFQTTHNPQPIAIGVGQVYVGQRDQVDIHGNDPREVIVDKCLIFGNQVRGEVTWQKVDKFGELLGGVIFTLTRTHDFDPKTGEFIDIVDVPITVQDNLPPDDDNQFGLYSVDDLPLGRYTLEETFPIPGYDPDTFIETFELTKEDPFHVAEHVWVNRWTKRALVGSTYAARLEYLESIGLTLVNDPVAAANLSVMVPAAASSFELDLMENDYFNENGNSIEIVDFSNPSQGGYLEMIDGKIFYTPPTRFNGPAVETFTYTISNGTATDSATVTLFSPAELTVGEVIRSDVNGDGEISPLDALMIINDLATNGPRDLSDSAYEDWQHLDTNGDGHTSPLDVLFVINDLVQPTPQQAMSYVGPQSTFQDDDSDSSEWEEVLDSVFSEFE